MCRQGVQDAIFTDESDEMRLLSLGIRIWVQLPTVQVQKSALRFYIPERISANGQVGQGVCWRCSHDGTFYARTSHRRKGNVNVSGV